MFSKEASKALRKEFWISFGKSFPRKWILYNTKIKNFSFKFYFDTKKALVALDIEDPDLEKRIHYYEKLESLKSALTENYLPDAIYSDIYFLENGKEISRIYVLKENVCIHNKNTWQETMQFLNETMIKFEEFYTDFEDFIKS
ncbi:DUF4268 domain-containing protein [Galbibacter pacificus]|uniref:DUF4268 domain-containing protein n=1 Tax=Galbibacter pacificus TaxID=2996052 RepID=A0ABT6FVL4_9FLAO|nr:DUF4268 domain-containing protein [Galbibacter pacificus]MDG3583384.1 DUF4268 domain-containing protein [Galbibacter pacificus]MDG3587139.1 DUF4268 domain-containing protein [Galbibacter pacificus]